MRDEMTDSDGRLERKAIIAAEEMNVAVRGLAADGIVIELCGHPQALAPALAEAAEILSPVRGLDGGGGIHDRVGLLEAACRAGR
jgi:hypothetical protein